MNKPVIWIGTLSAGVSIALGIFAFPYRGSIEGALHLQEKPPQKSARLLFVGDMMFDRSIRAAAQEKGYDYLFSCVADRLREFDAVIGNLEGPITDTPSVSLGSRVNSPENYTFTFSPEVAPLLKRHNVSIVNLGNNHIFNFKLDGVLETKHYLDKAGVAHFGDPDVIERERVLRKEIGGILFSFINWSDWTSDNTDITGNQIREEAASGRTVIVYTHWGEEYVEPTDRMRTLAHQFIDDGASIVIGSHPHIVQERELYRGRYVYYSLGNFIFDQYWNDAVSHGPVLEVNFSDAQIEVREHPIELTRDRRVCFIPNV